MKKKILTVVGARPQFIKASALSRPLVDHPVFEEVLVNTGQHFDDAMSRVFFQELGMPKPAYDLKIAGGGHGDMTGRMMAALEPLMIEEKPWAVLVYGDTNSTLAGALVAAKLHIPVIHVEAGLRSFNRTMPEEINRVLTDHMSTFLFCPTQTALDNLRQEGIGCTQRSGREAHVFHVGDIMADTVAFARAYLADHPEVGAGFAFGDKPFALMTLHREETTRSLSNFQKALSYALAWAEDNGCQLVCPVHPRIRPLLERTANPALLCLPPVGYFEMQALLSKAGAVLTDSGGLQKEAYFHRVPCITLRSETEWVETVTSGWNRLWTETDTPQRSEISDYGTGDTAARILAALAQ